MSKGDVTALSRLHGKLTEYYNKRLDNALKEPEDVDELSAEDMFLNTLSPAELTAMNNFLKQNSITADIKEDQGLSDLEAKLADKRKRGVAKLASVSSIRGAEDGV